LSSHHPDDHSVYHHEDGDGVHVRGDAESLRRTETQRREDGDGGSITTSDESGSVKEKENTDVAEHGGRERVYEEIRGGVPFERDVEVGEELEKKKSARSIKDPNLVSQVKPHLYFLSNPSQSSTRPELQLTSIGNMGILHRPPQPQKLVPPPQMGRHAHRLLLHARLAHFLIHDFSRPRFHKPRFPHHE
jgi:hypothetical protein